MSEKGRLNSAHLAIIGTFLTLSDILTIMHIIINDSNAIIIDDTSVISTINANSINIASVGIVPIYTKKTLENW